MERDYKQFKEMSWLETTLWVTFVFALLLLITAKLIVYYQNWIVFQTHKERMTDTTVIEPWSDIAECTVIEAECKDGLILRGL